MHPVMMRVTVPTHCFSKTFAILPQCGNLGQFGGVIVVIVVVVLGTRQCNGAVASVASVASVAVVARFVHAKKGRTHGRSSIKSIGGVGRWRRVYRKKPRFLLALVRSGGGGGRKGVAAGGGGGAAGGSEQW